MARVEPQDSLAATWKTISERMTRGVTTVLGPKDELRVPLLDFRLRGEFAAPQNVQVQNFSFENRIRATWRDVMLRLNETGADFISEAELLVIGENGGDYLPPPKPRILRLDRPFLNAFCEQRASQRYFLAWIATTELMVAAEPAP